MTFESFKLYQAATGTAGTAALSVTFITNSTTIQLDYCIPKNFSKKRTDVTGVQSDTPLHPDTGPAGAFVELQLTLDRTGTIPDILSTLIDWYSEQNTNSEFQRGFLGLTTDDNSQLTLDPVSATAGYRLIQFEQLDPVDFKGRQVYRILIQFSGDTDELGT